MKLVRFGDRRTGLVVDLEAGPHIIDVVASVGALLPHDPISNGVLNGILREGGDWAPLIEHWSHASAGLRRLINLALMAPDHPHLVLRTYDDAQVMLHDSCGIVALEISETREIQFWDPTGRAVMRALYHGSSRRAYRGRHARCYSRAQFVPLHSHIRPHCGRDSAPLH